MPKLIKGGSFEMPIRYMAYIPQKDERKYYFKSILEFYKTEIPNFTLIYGLLTPYERMVLNRTQRADDFYGKVDYVLIFTVPSKRDNSPIYIIEAPIVGTERSTVGFQYAKENSKLNEFRNMVVETATRMSKESFDEFIYQMSYEELYEGYKSRETSKELSDFYNRLPRNVRLELQQGLEPSSEDMILDTNAMPLTGVLTLDPNFWMSKDNQTAMTCNSMILSTYYNKR